MSERADDEMDVSDEEENIGQGGQRKRARFDTNEQERSSLKDENDSLRCQLEAYKNEVEVVRSEMKAEIENKEKQLKMLQQTLHGMQQQLIESKRRQNEDEHKVKYSILDVTRDAFCNGRFLARPVHRQSHT